MQSNLGVENPAKEGRVRCGSLIGQWHFLPTAGCSACVAAAGSKPFALFTRADEKRPNSVMWPSSLLS